MAPGASLQGPRQTTWGQHKKMVLPDYIVEAATRETDSSDLETLKDWVEESGGDINDVDEDGCTILNLSLIFDNPETVRWAIAHGADVNKPGDMDGDHPLYTAIGSAEVGFGLEAAAMLLDAGASIDARTTATIEGVYIAGETALSNAIDWLRYDRIDMAEKGLAYVKLLLRRGAKLDGCWGGRSAEECLRQIEDPSAFPEYEAAYSSTIPPTDATKETFIACKKLIANERRRRYLLQRKEILRLRSLALRGRAKPDALLAAVARLPNEMAWHVISYWRLGEV